MTEKKSFPLVSQEDAARFLERIHAEQMRQAKADHRTLPETE